MMDRASASPMEIVRTLARKRAEWVAEKAIRSRFALRTEQVRDVLGTLVESGLIEREVRGRGWRYRCLVPPGDAFIEWFDRLAALEDAWVRERIQEEEVLPLPATDETGSISRFLDHMVFLEETASVILGSLEKVAFSHVFLETFRRLFFAVDYDIGIAMTIGADLKVYMIRKKGVTKEIQQKALRSARELMNLVVALPFLPSTFTLEMNLEEMEPVEGTEIKDRIGVSFERDRMTPGLLALFRLTNNPFLADEKQVLDVLSSQISLACLNINALEKIREQAVTDELTGISNKRAFRQRFAEEFERAKRYGYALSLCMMDLDYFKAINDRYGHQQGDVVLSEVAALILATVRVRVSDFLARYGGEEFVLMLPHTGLQRAGEVAEKIRYAVEACEFPGELSSVRCTLSIGVAIMHEEDLSPDELIARADMLMYRAKAQGRNLVITE